ncbi:hypothetical protein CP532_0782 [Ophiocordyceps camponoti-leonardi (nom. inval.)]|nr:hypothetical protein CP532_0782 [Ophiocordyceps camponoti-leonardi (nom. inval.)]
MNGLPVSNKAPGDDDFAPLRNVCAHLNAFHAYADDGSRSVETNHYCGHVNDDVRQCLLYDSDESNARLIGIEYMITKRLYEKLPQEERRLWHSHVYEVKSGMLVMPNRNVPSRAWDLAETREMRQVVTLYGKAYHLWQTDRGDALPLGEPRLMTSFVADGQLPWEEVERRDGRLGTDYRAKREARKDIEEPEVDAENSLSPPPASRSMALPCIIDDCCAPSSAAAREKKGAVSTKTAPSSRDTTAVEEKEAAEGGEEDDDDDEKEEREEEEKEDDKGDGRVQLVRVDKAKKKTTNDGHDHENDVDDGLLYDFPPASRLENNLPWAVGFLELANAGDFAANVWNEVPVPQYAMVLMAFGGTLAFLRSALRSVSFRELYNEIINRLAMDILMGAGALLIAAGTFMAMGGGNERVWYASNILSGYLGNTPLALFALVNSSWAGYLAYTAQRHVRATRSSPASALVKRRSRNVQVFCLINGTAAVVGGVGSMLTATRWWAYVLLAPVVVSSIFCNLWWRRRVGYTRARTCFSSVEELLSDLEFAAWADVILRKSSSSSRPLSRLMADPSSLPEVLRWLRRHHLLPDVCVAAANDPHLRPALVASSVSASDKSTSELDLGLPELLALPAALHPRLLDVADECVGRLGALHFRHRERFLAELLGSYSCVGGRAPDVEEVEK